MIRNDSSSPPGGVFAQTSMITLPDSNIRVLGPETELDYFDTQGVRLGRELDPLEVWNIAMARPQPVLRLAFGIRDAVSSLFGVKKIVGFSGTWVDQVEPGGFLDFFRVEYRDATTLVLTERDKHLDVMTCIATQGPSVTITSSVKVHNWFGRAYMVPVGLAHRWIVRGLLRRVFRSVQPAD